MSELRDQHKAFAEWFLQQNPIAPNAENLAWAAWKAALSAPDDADPMAWMYTFHGVNRLVFANDAGPYITAHGTPLYTHPPRSDVPDELPMPPAGHPLYKLGDRLAHYLDDDKFNECERLLLEGWNHDRIYRKTGEGWRDIEPPEQEVVR